MWSIGDSHLPSTTSLARFFDDQNGFKWAIHFRIVFITCMLNPMANRTQECTFVCLSNDCFPATRIGNHLSNCCLLVVIVMVEVKPG